jgi:hypothetical protein
LLEQERLPFSKDRRGVRMIAIRPGRAISSLIYRMGVQQSLVEGTVHKRVGNLEIING